MSPLAFISASPAVETRLTACARPTPTSPMDACEHAAFNLGVVTDDDSVVMR
jgi:hypothetical protein